MLAAMPAASFTDWFQLGPAIQDRLRDPSQVLNLADVGGLAALADALAGAKDSEIAQRVSALYPRCPAAAVGYDGDLIQYDTDGGGHGLAQRWLVVLVVRHAGDTAKNETVQAEAGPLILQVVQSLSGWRPSISHLGELRHIAGPRPSYGPGIGLFPLAFLAPVHVPGVNL